MDKKITIAVFAHLLTERQVYDLIYRGSMFDKEFKDKIERIITAIKPFSVPIYFSRGNARDPSEIFSNATVSLVDTGQKKLFITCYHVWSAFQEIKHRETNINLWLYTGHGKRIVNFNDAKLIDGDRNNLDIAILDFWSKDIFQDNNKRFYEASEWPLPPPSKGDIIGFWGYPGIHRSVHNSGEGIVSGGVLFFDFVSSVTERYIRFSDEDKIRMVTEYIPGAKSLTSLGGISGSPVFVNRNNKFELIGFAQEAGDGPHATVFITPAHFIKADGTLNRIIMPWL